VWAWLNGFPDINQAEKYSVSHFHNRTFYCEAFGILGQRPDNEVELFA